MSVCGDLSQAYARFAKKMLRNARCSGLSTYWMSSERAWRRVALSTIHRLLPCDECGSVGVGGRTY